MSNAAHSTVPALLAAIFLIAAAPPAVPTRDDLARDNRLFIQGATKVLKWEVPTEPLRIVGPIYFVGTQGLGSYLITTSEGHILLGTGMPSSGPMIAESIRKLGFRPEDIKVILTWHAHADHAGAIAYFKQLSGAQLAIMDGDVASMEDGGKSDFHYGWDWKTMGFPAAKVDRVLRDGDRVKLGDVELTALSTPGHTRGDTSWVTTVTDRGKAYVVVWPDGTSVNPGYRVARRPSYPGIGDDYRRTLARLERLKPDIWLVSHTDRFGLDEKRERAAAEGPAAFVDPEGYRKYIAAQRAAFEEEVAREMAAPSADDGVRRGPAPKQGSSSMTTPASVTLENFTRAETDTYFAAMVAEGGIGRLSHHRELVPIDRQVVVRSNRDTLYSQGVFDLDAGPVTITLPEAGGRFLSALAINQDHYAVATLYDAGPHRFSRDEVGTRYLMLLVRTFVDPNDPEDVAAVHALQDAIRVEQQSPGRFEIPAWDPASLKRTREEIGAWTDFDPQKAFGARGEVDRRQHLIGTARGWGGNPARDAIYVIGAVDRNDGTTLYRLTVKDVPVDGFWSVSVYNSEGFFEANPLGAYTLNNITAHPDADGGYTIRFGGCETRTPNCLPIMPGWGYTVRLYRPRADILDGRWVFPPAEAVR